MLKIAEGLKKNINFKAKLVQNDNLVFKLHYRITVWLLMVCTVLVCSQEYIGEHIRCLHSDPSDDKKKLEHVIDRFCFFMATFTVVKHLNKSVSQREIAHPGVGPNNQDDESIVHAYYQWVPFVLFLQALCFYIPHLVWRLNEKKVLGSLVSGFRTLNSSIVNYFDKEQRDECLKKVKREFKERLEVHRLWAWKLIFCELCNVVNLIFQIWFTDLFLGGQFMSLGPKVYWDYDADNYNPLDVVFPKVTKCTFRKYGPSGAIQYHDVMCVMALNIINEKIYIMLWFWYTFLFAVTVAGFLWRLSTILFYGSNGFNLWAFRATTGKKLDEKSLLVLMKKYRFSEWTFFRYLALNLDEHIMQDLVKDLAGTLAIDDDDDDDALSFIDDSKTKHS